LSIARLLCSHYFMAMSFARFTSVLFFLVAVSLPAHGFRQLKKHRKLAHEEQFNDELATTAALQCTLGQPVLFTSIRGQQLEERRGNVGMSGDTGSYQKWVLTSAGSGRVFITSRLGKQLEDRSGRIGLSSDKGSVQQWTVSSAPDSMAYLTSRDGNNLQDSSGSVSLSRDLGSTKKWSITLENGRAACSGGSSPPSPVPSPQPPRRRTRRRAGPVPSGEDMQRSGSTRLRVGCYNVYRDRVFKGERVEAFRQLHRSMQPDVWAMQEVSYRESTAPKSEGDRWLDVMRKNTGDNSWNYSWNARGLYVLSKHPIAHTWNFSHRVMATWIRLPSSISSNDLVLVDVHLAPGNKKQTRRDQAALGIKFLNDVRAGRAKAGSKTVPKDATLMFVGDFNSKPDSSPWNLVRSMDTGYQKDGYKNTRTEMNDAEPRHLRTGERATHGNMNSGKMVRADQTIDHAFYRTSSSDLSFERSFIPNTIAMSDQALSSNNVRKMDVAMNPDSKFDFNKNIAVDHLPLIVDFKRR